MRARKFSTVAMTALCVLSAGCFADESGVNRADELSMVLLGQSLIEHDPRQYVDAPLQSVTPLLNGADVVFSNLEVSICPGNVECEATRTDQYFHGAGPEVLDYLRSIGVNLLSLSNNHSWDYGTEGVVHGIDEANRRGFVHAGTGLTEEEAVAPAYMEASGYRIALVASASAKLKPGAVATAGKAGVNILLPEDDLAWQRNIASIKKANATADIVIVYQHFQSIGTEEWQQSWARAAIDAGADIYVSHGEPVLSGVEQYKDGLIFYGLGNFVFHTRSEIGRYPVEAWRSVVTRISFKDGEAHRVEFVPVVLDEGTPGENFLQARGYPALASGDAANQILGSLAKMSLEFGTDLEVRDGRGYLVREK